MTAATVELSVNCHRRNGSRDPDADSDREYTHLFQRPDPDTLVLPLATCRVLLSQITVPLSLTLHLAPPPHGAARPEHTGQRSRLTICRTYKEEREPYTVALPVALS